MVMMYVKYPLSLRTVEDVLAERGIDLSRETVRHCWKGLVRCSPPRSVGRGVIACGLTPTGGGTATSFP